MSIERFPSGLSVRAERVLARNGLTTVEQIENTSDVAFLNTRDCGITTLHEIRCAVDLFRRNQRQQKQDDGAGILNAWKLIRRDVLAGMIHAGQWSRDRGAGAPIGSVEEADRMIAALDRTAGKDGGA